MIDKSKLKILDTKNYDWSHKPEKYINLQI